MSTRELIGCILFTLPFIGTTIVLVLNEIDIIRVPFLIGVDAIIYPFALTVSITIMMGVGVFLMDDTPNLKTSDSKKT